jgi:hypothetical protein
MQLVLLCLFLFPFSATKKYSYVISSLFWDVIQHVFLVSYRRFGTDKPRSRTLYPWIWDR